MQGIVSSIVAPAFNSLVSITEEKFAQIMKPEIQPTTTTNNQQLWFQ